MDLIVFEPKFYTKQASKPLSAWVSHYWLSLDSTQPTHSVLPDGAVDVVIQITGSSARSWVYGTSTVRTDIALNPHSRYLGIRFKPGQSRHFIQAAASELTDRCEDSDGLLRFPLDSVLELGMGTSVFTRIDALLESHIRSARPERSRMDEAIDLIKVTHGTASTEQAAQTFCRSRRQFERIFAQTVGISPKLFAQIARFEHAAACIGQPLCVAAVSLADVAASAGYADQSHMTHAFKRFAQTSPYQFARENVAFLQGITPIILEN
jgi:AraC-like DNA-binding protein